MRNLAAVRVIGALVLAVGCSRLSQAQDPVLVGAGDVADCGASQLSGPEATATLLDSISGTVFAVGDLSYPDGTDANFSRCYDPTWGRHRSRTIPAAGNHEYNTPGAAPYYNYFGPPAGDPSKGYYSFDLGAWHVIVLNSECGQVGGCNSGSPQLTWLQADLAAHPALCTVALWHRPLFSSTTGTISNSVKPFWQTLYSSSVDLILNGHAHNYERFAPQDPNGAADPVNGIREFISGTGGASHNAFTTVAANSEVRNANTFGVLKLTLHPAGYDWQFVPQAGKTFTDSGSATCH